MLDPDELYVLADDAPKLDGAVLIHALSGFVDAGNAVRLAREHLLSGPGGDRIVATFDVDRLLDYRSRRPVMLFVEDHWEEYEEPRLALHLLTDAAGVPFLLLAGPEPDLHWERFTEALIRLVDRLGVRLTVGLNSIPMAVPHTRPTSATAHGTRPELIAGYEPWVQRVQVPGSVGHLIEFRLGRRSRAAIGFAAHVPHYLAQAEYPAAAETLLESVARVTGLVLPVGKLHDAAGEVRVDIDQQIAQNDEAAALVRALEQQYDAFVRGRRGTDLLAGGGTLPTGDELGAELERFLAEHTKPTDPPA